MSEIHMFGIIMVLLAVLNSFLWINCKQNWLNAQRLFRIEARLEYIERDVISIKCTTEYICHKLIPEKEVNEDELSDTRG